jgi:hypothetical protein
MLETTVPPNQRLLPGYHLDIIQRWLGSEELIISNS